MASRGGDVVAIGESSGERAHKAACRPAGDGLADGLGGGGRLASKPRAVVAMLQRATTGSKYVSRGLGGTMAMTNNWRTAVPNRNSESSIWLRLTLWVHADSNKQYSPTRPPPAARCPHASSSSSPARAKIKKTTTTAAAAPGQSSLCEPHHPTYARPSVAHLEEHQPDSAAETSQDAGRHDTGSRPVDVPQIAQEHPGRRLGRALHCVSFSFSFTGAHGATVADPHPIGFSSDGRSGTHGHAPLPRRPCSCA